MKQQDHNQKTREQSEEMEHIEQLINKGARYQKDPVKFSQLFTEQAVIVNVAGLRLTGRDEIYVFMEKAANSFLSAVSIRNEVTNIIFLRPDVAVVNGIQHIFTENGKHQEETAAGSLTFVVVKEQGKWLMAAGQNTLIDMSKHPAQTV